MSTTTDSEQRADRAPSALISHGGEAGRRFEDALSAVRARIEAAGPMPGATVEQQLALLDELAGFELGRFLIEHRGLNAYWTHQIVTYRSDVARAGGASGDLYSRIFQTLPSALATRERFGIFQRELQALLRPGLTLASVPCGVMGELLLLDYAACPDVSLVGIDLDAQAIDAAQALAAQRGLAPRVALHCADAWALDAHEAFDVLTSNGLNIYEPDDERVTALYRGFFAALKPGGRLVTSFLTPPPMLSAQSPWDMTAIDPAALALQHLLFVRLIDAKWSTFRTHAQTQAQLEAAGFVDIAFIDDRARLFPTVLATRPA